MQMILDCFVLGGEGSGLLLQAEWFRSSTRQSMARLWSALLPGWRNP